MINILSVMLGLFLFSAATVSAQEIVENAAGEKIRLNPNMKWEYVESDKQDIGQMVRDGIGLAMLKDYDAAIELAESIKSAPEHDMLLANIFNFASMNADCTAQKDIVSRFADTGMRGLYTANLEALCPK